MNLKTNVELKFISLQVLTDQDIYKIWQQNNHWMLLCVTYCHKLCTGSHKLSEAQ